MTDKIDFKKTLDAYRAQRGRFRIVDVPDMQYLKIDGRGDPNTSPAFAEAIGALYPLAYKLKFSSKRDLGRDYVVPPLEGLWSADDMDAFTSARDKSRWDWTLMLMVPDWIDQALFATATDHARAKDPPARLADVRLDALSEGRCVQTLHIGSFDAEAAVLARLHHEFIPDNGLRMTGHHHEIYLSDFRRVAPDKQRTILRQPVTPTAQDRTRERSFELGSTRSSALGCIPNPHAARRLGHAQHQGLPREIQIAARHAAPRTTTSTTTDAKNLDKHATYVVVAFVAGEGGPMPSPTPARPHAASPLAPASSGNAHRRDRSPGGTYSPRAGAEPQHYGILAVVWWVARGERRSPNGCSGRGRW